MDEPLADGATRARRLVAPVMVVASLVEARTEQRELTQKVGSDGWQHQAGHLLHSCLTLVDPGCEPLPAKVDGLRR